MSETFACRLSFVASHPIAHDDEALELPYRASTVAFRSANGSALRETTDVAAISKGHRTADAAKAFGTQLKDDLQCVSVLAGIGIDIGKDRFRSGLTKAVADKVKEETGITFLPDIHGLLIYEDDGCSVVGKASATAWTTTTPELFAEALKKSITTKVLNAKMRTAIELFSASYFGSNATARLILSVAAVEAMGPRGVRSDEYIRLLELAIGAVRVDESTGDDKDLLLKELGRLAVDAVSIRKSYFDLIAGALDLATAQEFRRIHDSTRSKLVHGETVPPQLTEHSSRAQAIARDLLKKLLTA